MLLMKRVLHLLAVISV